uniref:Uncharacterized protein n=1 Tax=Sexangularia sp. CB-2014 TaxID=1486929 RepID=A0A7S1VNW4_9EUKA
MLVFLLSLCFSLSFSCGGFFCNIGQPVVQSAERIFFALLEDNVVEMTVQIAYQGPAVDFSWVLPLPSVPNFAVGTDELFTQLHARTDPTFVMGVEADSCDVPCSGYYYADGDVLQAASEADDVSDSVSVLAEGAVGPFDYKVVFDKTRTGDPMFTWLNENGYDQPVDALPLIRNYAEDGHVFVALKLQKDKESGDIQPLVVKFEAPGEGFSCVPIVLTRIAAREDMPIHVWVAGEARAVPLNYLDVEIDLRSIDWLRCASKERLRNSDNRYAEDVCYRSGVSFGFASDSYCSGNYLRAVSEAIDDAGGAGFVTEYAGPSSIMERLVYPGGWCEDTSSPRVRFDKAELAALDSPNEFLLAMASQGLPRTGLMQQIIRSAIPKPDDSALPSECEGEANFYRAVQGGEYTNVDDCSEYIPGSWTFNAAAFADDIATRVIEPMRRAQGRLDDAAYLTKLTTTMDPAEMVKDPFFVQSKTAPQVSRVRRALATAQCDNVCSDKDTACDGFTGVELTFPDSDTPPVTHPGSEDSCYGNPMLELTEILGTTAGASRMRAWNVNGTLRRGTIANDEVATAQNEGDALLARDCSEFEPRDCGANFTAQPHGPFCAVVCPEEKFTGICEGCASPWESNAAQRWLVAPSLVVLATALSAASF